MKNLLVFICLLFLISSCSDNPTSVMMEVEPSIPVEKVLLLKEIYRDDILFSSYIFNSDSTLQSSIQYTDGEPNFETAIQYSLDEITSTTTNLASGQISTSRKYSRVSDNQGKREQFNSQGELSTTTIYSFNNDPCGYISTQRIDAFNNLIYETRIDFDDENCSSIFYKNFEGTEEYVEWEYTRIDKFDASNSIILPFFRVKKQHAVIKQIRKTSAGTTSTNLSYDAVFEFNEDDHPTKEIRTYLDGDVEVYTYVYYLNE